MAAPLAELTAQAQSLTSVGDLVGARDVLAHVLDPADATDPRRATADLAVAAALNARILIALGDPHSARLWAGFAHAAEERLHGPHDERTLAAAATHAAVLHRVGNYGRAAQLYHDLVLELITRDGPDSLQVLAAQADLATAEHSAGHCTAARARLTEAFSRHRRVYGDAAPAGIKMLARLGALERECGRLTESREHLAMAQELCARYLPDDHPLGRQITLLAEAPVSGQHYCGRVAQSTGPEPGGTPIYTAAAPGAQAVPLPTPLPAPGDLTGRHARTEAAPPLPGDDRPTEQFAARQPVVPAQRRPPLLAPPDILPTRQRRVPRTAPSADAPPPLNPPPPGSLPPPLSSPPPPPSLPPPSPPATAEPVEAEPPPRWTVKPPPADPPVFAPLPADPLRVLAPQVTWPAPGGDPIEYAAAEGHRPDDRPGPGMRSAPPIILTWTEAAAQTATVSPAFDAPTAELPVIQERPGPLHTGLPELPTRTARRPHDGVFPVTSAPPGRAGPVGWRPPADLPPVQPAPHPEVVREAPDRRLPVPIQRPVHRPARQPWLLIAVLIAGLLIAGAVVFTTLRRGGDTSAAPAATSRSGAAGTSAPSAPSAPAPSDAGLAPQRVKLHDNRDSVSLTWEYPADAEGPVLISGGRKGQEQRAFQQLAAGTSDYVVYGLNNGQDYCFTIAVVYTVDRVAASEPICTTRK